MQIITTFPFLFFCVLLFGYSIGKIKIKSISLGASGVLMTAIAVGSILPQSALGSIKESASLFSAFGSALFVSAIGLSACMSLTKMLKKKTLLFFLLGIVMTMVAFTVMSLVLALDRSIDASLLYGVLCGALTSTPGLSALHEHIGIDSEAATLGYGFSYIFGVLSTVIATQLVASRRPQNAEDHASPSLKASEAKSSVLYTAGSVIMGTALGAIRLPVLSLSLGNTGGILAAGILIGMLAKHRQTNIEGSLKFTREWGLYVFLAASGLLAGNAFSLDVISPRSFLYAVLFAAAPIIFGFLFCRVVLRCPARDTATAIAGGMTSSPAFGALLESGDEPNASIYSITYLGALIATVIGIQIL